MSAREAIRRYIQREFLEDSPEIADDHPLLETGILNSLGVMRLVAFAEREFQVRIPNADVNARNFSSIRAFAAYIDEREDSHAG